MECYVLDLRAVDRTRLAQVGGKAAQLGELSRIAGVRVPAGFVVTTDAYRRVVAQAPSLDAQLEQLARARPEDRDALAAALRATLDCLAVPDEVASAIAAALASHPAAATWAVRSSATLEDSPGASFAGLHETFLDVAGSPAAILERVQRCWSSLFTDRAVAYRLRHAIDPHDVAMAVVVQRMVAAQAAGVLFTADPLTGHRRVATVEAVRGLGEGLVAGRVVPEVFEVREGMVVARQLAAAPALSEPQVVRLVELGRRIEAHFGQPQDIEWCLAEGELHIVQSRPITTLFPVPAADDGANHVYLSVGHQQMMTDAMKPLGISVFRLTAGRPMVEAGGRLFVDVTPMLASPASRSALLEMLGRADPLLQDALQSLLKRGDFVAPLPDGAPGSAPPSFALPPPALDDADAALVAELIGRSEASIAALQREIATKHGTALLDFVRADLQELRRLLVDPQSLGLIMSAMHATWWLNERLEAWLGERSAADVLTQSVEHNVTSQMGLALLDVADAIRPHPEVVAFLERGVDDGFLDALPGLPGGREAREALESWLEAYGMRGPGEIDLTRPRWRERPSMLVPVLLGHVHGFEPGESGRRFARGLREAREKEAELLERLRALPDGAQKAEETRRMIERVRTFIGYREYPKYGMIRRYFVYKQALLGEAARLVEASVLDEAEDIFFLTLDELDEVVRTQRIASGLVDARKQAFESARSLRPPRVITSDGEVIRGAHRRGEVPAGALVGLAVSAGVVEGRARVVLDMAQARLEAGDILVTTFTDPSWTPLFVRIAGLVTEVGGLMTHGAVIAREYGLPAVVGVEDATRRIRDGQRIRVDATRGTVELLG